MSHHTDSDLEARLAASFDKLDIRTPAFHASTATRRGSWRIRRYALMAVPTSVLFSAKGAFAAASVAAKIAMATVGTLAVVGTAIGVKTAVTGSPNPASWGQTTVVPAVQSCKAAIPSPRPTGSANGIGDCVSDVAQQHGAAQSSAHAESGETSSGTPGQSGAGHGNSSNAPGHSGTDHGNGNGNSSHSGGHPTPPVPTPAHPTPH